MKTAVIEKKGDGYEARLEQVDGKFVIQHARKEPLIEYCRLRDFDTIIVEPILFTLDGKLPRIFLLTSCVAAGAA